MNDQLQLLTTAANVLWLLLAGFLVFFMQAGFALVETGFTRSKNVAHTMMMNMMVFSIWAIGYWICGFAFLLGAAIESDPARRGYARMGFAASGVVHITGGAVALAVAMALGPRIGRFNKDGSANTIPGHNIPLGTLGAIILFFGWFGFNPGSAIGLVIPAVVDASGNVTTAANMIPINLSSLAAVNTLLAGAAGGFSAMVYNWLFGPTKKPSPSLSVNG